MLKRQRVSSPEGIKREDLACVSKQTTTSSAVQALEHSPTLGPDQRDHSLDVVGEDVQRNLCFHVLQPSGKKVERAHPRLDEAKQVLDRASAHRHWFGRSDQPRPCRLYQVIMRPPCGSALLAGR